MGKRGPGAARQRQAKKLEPGAAQEFPWKNPKLSRVERVIAFLEWLPITKGILQGQKMQLLPNQREFVEAVYGNRETNVRIAIESEPRGNGKTGLLAGLALCHLLGPESETRGEVYSAAIDRQQAGIMFNEMEAIILREPLFARRTNIQRFHKRIEVSSDGEDGEGSIYEALSSDARRAHGLAPSLWVYDELAQAKDRVLLDNLMTAMGKRKRSLGIIISTQAPKDDHPLSQLIDDAGADPTIVVHLTCAPPDADPFDPDVIAACNPALGIFLDREDVMRNAELARRNPAFLPAHQNLRLNQRVDASEALRIVPLSIWKQGDEPVLRERLKGRECFGGLDLSGKHDLCALVLVFPDEASNVYEVLPFFWTPEGQLDNRKPAERDLFKLWIKQGQLNAVPGPVIRFGWVARELAKLSVEFRIRCVAYDRWRIDDFKQDLDDEGCAVQLEPFGQGFKDMGPAVEYFAEKALDGGLRHGAHPILKAGVVNGVLVSDPAGNQKFDKEKSNTGATVRIDGVVALAMALGIARRFIDERKPEYQLLFV